MNNSNDSNEDNNNKVESPADKFKKKPGFPTVRMYSTINRDELEKEISKYVLEHRYKIGKSTIYDDEDRTDQDRTDAEFLQTAMNTMAVKEREIDKNDNKTHRHKKKPGIQSNDEDQDIFFKMFEIQENDNHHKSYLTRKSSSIRGSSRTRPSKTKRQSSMQSFSNLAFRHHSSASQRAAVINQRIDRDKSIFGKVRIKIPIINNFE